MTDRSTGASSSGIKQRQDDLANLVLQHAKKRRYDVADRWANVTVGGTVAFALLVPFAALVWPATAAWLSAVAAGWLVMGKGWCQRRQEADNAQAARYQEMFETRLFALPWNEALCGRRPGEDEIARDAQRVRNEAGQTGWFYDDGTTPRPADVLLAQLENVLWGKSNHAGFASLFRGVGVAVFLVGIVIASVLRLEMTDYLIRLLFPCLPALQDSFLLAGAHRNQAEAKKRLEEQIIELLDRYARHATVEDLDLRSVQDGAYQLRVSGPNVPSWFYKLQKSKDSKAIHAAMDSWRDKLAASTSP